MSNLSDQERQRRWESESEFFDNWAESTSCSMEAFDSKVLDRYQHSGTLYHKEYRFHAIGALAGRNVLDVGCGEGQNSVLLAKLGANVVGIDISPKAIEVAQQRSEIAKVANRCRFICSPLEIAPDLGGPFDIIWGDAILHHLILELDEVMTRLVSVTRPGGLHVYSEPINLCHTLRRIRRMLPIETEATPDERPLEQTELTTVKTFLPDLQMIPFHLLGRLHPFILKNGSYERSSQLRRTLSKSLAIADKLLFTFPGVDRLAGYAVLLGHVSCDN